MNYLDLSWCLASGSPRRLELLRDVGIEPVVCVSQFEELHRENEPLRAYLKRNCFGKIDAVLERLGEEKRDTMEHSIFLSADTVVVKDDRLLEKPRDQEDAIEMLSELSGAVHEVWTAFLLKLQDRGQTKRDLVFFDTVVTKVYFRDLLKTEIDEYVKSGMGMDKSGSYGAQDRARCFISKVEGSYTNVIGLPVAEVLAAANELVVNNWL